MKPASQTVLMELRPSSELAFSELAELFTAAYEDYHVPFQVDEARLAEVITQNEPASALYEKLGFRTTRELAVVTLTAAEGGQA